MVVWGILTLIVLKITCKKNVWYNKMFNCINCSILIASDSIEVRDIWFIIISIRRRWK